MTIKNDARLWVIVSIEIKKTHRFYPALKQRFLKFNQV